MADPAANYAAHLAAIWAHPHTRALLMMTGGAIMTGFYYEQFRPFEHTIDESASKLPANIEVFEDEQQMFDKTVVAEDIPAPLSPAPNFPVPSIWGHPNTISYTPGKPWNQATTFYIDNGYVQVNPTKALLSILIPLITSICFLVWFIRKCTRKDRTALSRGTDGGIPPNLVCNPTPQYSGLRSTSRDTPPSVLPPGLFHDTSEEGKSTTPAPHSRVPMQGRSPSPTSSPPKEVIELRQKVQNLTNMHRASQARACKNLDDKEKIERALKDRIIELEALLKFAKSESEPLRAQLEAANKRTSDSDRATSTKSELPQGRMIKADGDEMRSAQDEPASELVEAQVLLEDRDAKVPTLYREHIDLVRQPEESVDTNAEMGGLLPPSPTVTRAAEMPVSKVNVVLPERSIVTALDDERYDQPTATNSTPATIGQEQTVPLEEINADEKAEQVSGHETTEGAKDFIRSLNDGNKPGGTPEKTTETDVLSNEQTPASLPKTEVLVDRPVATDSAPASVDQYANFPTATPVGPSANTALPPMPSPRLTSSYDGPKGMKASRYASNAPNSLTSTTSQPAVNLSISIPSNDAQPRMLSGSRYATPQNSSTAQSTLNSSTPPRSVSTHTPRSSNGTRGYNNATTPTSNHSASTTPTKPADTHRCDVCGATFIDTEQPKKFTFAKDHYPNCRKWKSTWGPILCVRAKPDGSREIKWPPQWRHYLTQRPDVDPDWLVAARKAEAEQLELTRQTRSAGDGALNPQSAPFTPVKSSGSDTSTSLLKADVSEFTPPQAAGTADEESKQTGAKSNGLAVSQTDEKAPSMAQAAREASTDPVTFGDWTSTSDTEETTQQTRAAQTIIPEPSKSDDPQPAALLPPTPADAHPEHYNHDAADTLSEPTPGSANPSDDELSPTEETGQHGRREISWEEHGGRSAALETLQQDGVEECAVERDVEMQSSSAAATPAMPTTPIGLFQSLPPTTNAQRLQQKKKARFSGSGSRREGRR